MLLLDPFVTCNIKLCFISSISYIPSSFSCLFGKCSISLDTALKLRCKRMFTTFDAIMLLLVWLHENLLWLLMMDWCVLYQHPQRRRVELFFFVLLKGSGCRILTFVSQKMLFSRFQLCNLMLYIILISSAKLFDIFKRMQKIAGL